MRIAKTEELKNEIEIYSQNNQRELDSKEAFIQMLDKNLDEAQNQYQKTFLAICSQENTFPLYCNCTQGETDTITSFSISPGKN